MAGGDSILDAFWALSPDRPVGHVVGYIPFASIDRYAARFGIDSPAEFELFLNAIRAMDGKYLEIMRMKQEQSKKGGRK